jgi:Siroheme synthase (precorrin-2 oxidase/ferrochelatase domain)
LRFLEADSQVIILGNQIDPGLLAKGASLKPPKDAGKWVEWADLVVVASGDSKLNSLVTDLAGNKLLNRADQPDEGNVIVPSSFFIGDVQFSIFTQKKSPLMAREIRKKIEKVITEEDILQLDLQHYTRKILKNKVEGQKHRKSYLYKLLEDEKIKKLLNEGKIEEAKSYVDEMINSNYK